ncbi:MAG: response regulator [Balneolaceae bacterium]|nr:MAG: response regulator [Balneolaceae bacterium]
MTAFIIKDDAFQTILFDQAMLLEMIIYQMDLDLVGVEPCGKEAILKIAQLRPDIIWIDTPLSDCPDGVSIARNIRKIYQPIIIGLTGDQNPKSRSQAKSIGFHDCLVKPLSVSKVKSSVQSIRAAM